MVSVRGRPFGIYLPMPKEVVGPGLHSVELETQPYVPGVGDDRVLGIFLTAVELREVEPAVLAGAVDVTGGTPNDTQVTGLVGEVPVEGATGLWTEPHSLYLLRRTDAAPGQVEMAAVTGVNLRCDSHTVTVLFNGSPVATRSSSELPCREPFTIEGPVPSFLATHEVATVEVVVEPPFGRLVKGQEMWLGTVVQKVQVEQKPATGLLERLFFNKPEAVPQMAYGFFPQEEGLDGRWIDPAGAGYLLRVPEPSKPYYDLILNTVTFRPDKFTLRVYVNGDLVFAGQSGANGSPLQAEVPIPDHLQPGDLAFVEVTVDPPYIPRNFGIADDRVLGTFVRRTWLQ